MFGLAAGVCMLALPRSGSAQAFVVDGRVVERGGAGIANATVALGGHGFRLTSADGAFRFEGVDARQYVLRVEAFGYQTETRELDVDGDVSLLLELEISPLPLDSVVVESRTVELEGRVWDPVHDVPVAEAEVVTDQVDPARTSWGGAFKLRVAEGLPVRIGIRAFRYLPLDTLLVPAEGSRHRFALMADPLTERMIEVEIARLDDRAGGRRAMGMGPFNQEELRRWSGATLLEFLKTRFPFRGRRVQCIVLDERNVGHTMIGPTLQTVLIGDVERIEFLFRGAMLRVYTREFMKRMLGGGIELRPPAYSDMADPPLCR